MAGTPARERTRDYVIAQMKARGFDTEVRPYDVWLPPATAVRAARLGEDTVMPDLDEPIIPGDRAMHFPLCPRASGKSGEGVGGGEMSL